MKYLLSICLFLAPSAFAQTIQADCGSSTLFQSSGCGVHLYTPNNTYYGGIAYGAGRLQISASDAFAWKQNLIVLGDRQIGYSFDGIGLSLPLLGVSVERKTIDSDTMVFAGATGNTFSSPYLVSAVQPRQFGAGAFIKRRWRDVKLYSLEVVNDNKYTAAQGADFQWRTHVRLAGSAGIINSQPFVSGSADVRLSDWDVYLAHQTYFLPAKTVGDSAGLYWHRSHYTAQASINRSNYQNKTVNGESAGAGVQYGPVLANVNWYHSGSRTLLSELFVENLPHRVSLNESITQSGGQSSYAVGGSFVLSNRLSVSVNRSIIFLLNGEGFQQVTGVSLSLRLPHDVTANFQTVTTPLGQTLYSVYGEKYQQVGSWNSGTTVHAPPMGKYEYAGRVLDDSGAPVEGAAIQLGKVIAYTDRDGCFLVRGKRNVPLPIAVLPEVFAAPGNWEVVSAPESIAPKTDTVSRPSAIGSTGSGGSTIVVRRK